MFRHFRTKSAVFTRLGERIYSVLDLIYEMVSKILVKCCTNLFEDGVLAAWTKDRKWKVEVRATSA